MVSFGNRSSFEYVICANHTVHLAVQDILYKTSNKNNKTSPDLEIMNASESSSENEFNESFETDTSESEIDTDEVFEYETYGVVITNMRKIILHFRRSTVQNSILQKFIKREREEKS